MSSKIAAITDRYSCPQCLAVFRSGFARCPLCGDPLKPFDSDPLLGTTFLGKYYIEACIGEGGMGRVYRARHEILDKYYAIKILFGDHAADPKMGTRLQREGKAAARLSHRNVISVHDVDTTEDNLLYLLMDYVDGVDLASLIAKDAPFDRDRVINLCRQMCMGLGHAHDKGLIHRDFKSENVLITKDADGELAKIVDFGIAVMHEAASEGAHKLTSEGMVLGTPAFMAPEQATGSKVDHRADLFSLGVLMYEMLCGKLPFDGTPLEIARQNLAAIPPRISERVPRLRVEEGLEDIAFGLMAKRPEERFQSAHHVLRALDRVASQLGPARSGGLPDAKPKELGSTEVPMIPGGRKAAGKRDRRGSSDLPTLRSTLTVPTPADERISNAPIAAAEEVDQRVLPMPEGEGDTDEYYRLDTEHIAALGRSSVRTLLLVALVGAVLGGAGYWVVRYSGLVESSLDQPRVGEPVPAPPTSGSTNGPVPVDAPADPALEPPASDEPTDEAPTDEVGVDDNSAAPGPTDDEPPKVPVAKSPKDDEDFVAELKATLSVCNQVADAVKSEPDPRTAKALKSLVEECNRRVYPDINEVMRSPELRKKTSRELREFRKDVSRKLKSAL